MAEITNIERLRKAWDNAPTGAKNKVYELYDYTNQNVADILKNGRKDDQIILDLIEAIKIASAKVAEIANQQNEMVQAV